MSFLKRAIREGISKGIGDAVSSAVKQVIEPKATEWANKTAQQLDEMSQNHTKEVKQSFSGLEGAFPIFSVLRRTMQLKSVKT